MRSLSHISSSCTRTAGTQTDTEQDVSQDSIKRPKWRRFNRQRKSSSDESRTSGKDNYGYTSSPPGLSHGLSLDNLLQQESSEKNNFLLKYRQVSGDLRGSQELVDMDEHPDNEARSDFPRTRTRSMSYNSFKEKSVRDRSIIESKTVRKEKRKSRYRDGSGERPGTSLTPALRRVKLERDNFCYSNRGMDTSDEAGGGQKAPLAAQECDLSPVPALTRHSNYNASYRLATSQQLPRTSTKLALNSRPEPVRKVQSTTEPVYTVAGPGPIRRFTVPSVRHSQTLPAKQSPMEPQYQPQYQVAPPLSSGLSRGEVGRGSVYSCSTQDSGLYSQVSTVVRSPTPTAMFKLLALLLPPSYRRRLQLLLKFILKISLNHNLHLDANTSNRNIALHTFLEVILRPSSMSRHNRELANNIVQYFLDHYEQVWTPPQDLRREVEDQVYRSLVSRRLEAGEDPYPVTYCEQVTRNQYEENRLTGSQAALKDLLETILRDQRMERKCKKRKLKKFKEAYPEMWR